MFWYSHREFLDVLPLFIYIKINEQNLTHVLSVAFAWGIDYIRNGTFASTLLHVGCILPWMLLFSESEMYYLWMQISSSLILDKIAPTKQLTPFVKAKSLTRPR